MRKQMKRKKIVEAIEQQIIEAQEDLRFEEHQLSRAYFNGLTDGLGVVLQMLKPDSPVISLTSTWFADDVRSTQTSERQRERLIEIQYIDMEDPTPVGLFETAEAL